MVSDTDGCTQRVAAKFIAPTLPAQLACESRDGAGMPGLGLPRGEMGNKTLLQRKKYLFNFPGCSFSDHWKPQAYWMWRVEVQKASTG